MVLFPAVWWLFPIASLSLTVFSLYLTRTGGLENPSLRRGFVVYGALLGFIALALPFFRQPVFRHPFINIAIGVPLTAIGLVGRIYPMLYLRRQGTTTTLDGIERLVDTGPYRWVRHPQYSFGFVFMCGWFMAWGALYSLCLLPLLAVMVYVQALIEEEYLMGPQFGSAYAAYRERTGMLIPPLLRKTVHKL
jgi:protein-S-isoprenylcysteine O-methyltransferase Ste14